jgi:multisubunit Na+/H+ antiporter MnhG subunit
MENIQNFITKIQGIWVAIGSLLMILGTQAGISFPDFLLDIFSQATLDALSAVLGSVVVFYQYLRAIFAKDELAGVEVLVMSSNSKLRYLHPFRLKVVA